MKAVHITLEEDLLTELNCAARRLRTSRAEFIRDAIRTALHRKSLQQLEREHAAGYQHFPVQPDEFVVDEAQLEEVWGDL